jgi:hypothetical protein
LRVKNILDSFCRLYNDLKEEELTSKKEPEIILTVLNYETTLSTFNLLISESLYTKHNPHLSEQWEKIKRTIQTKITSANNTYPKVAVQWLNPALWLQIKVCAWLIVNCFEIATFGKLQIAI